MTAPTRMPRRARLAAVAAASLLAVAWSGAGERMRVRVMEKTLSHGGRERTYHVYAPTADSASGSPALMLILHGGGISGKTMARLTAARFGAMAQREGWLLVYPDAVDKHWNDGRALPRYRAHREQVDDVAFLTRLIDELAATMQADASRVYVVGMSSGALMAQRLACERAERVTAVASVGGTLAANLMPACAPSRPVPMLMINGTEDHITPWHGGDVRVGWLSLGKKLPVPETVAQWVRANGCPKAASVSWMPDSSPDDGTRVRRELYGPCQDASSVVFYVVDGGGHTWPGGTQYLPTRIIGRTSADLDATRAICEFFSAHQRRTVVSMAAPAGA